jgi:Helix-turn-helix.
MVAAAKDDERKGFAKRLNEAIDLIVEAPSRGRPAWLLIQLKETDSRLKLSQEAVRKWLSGESMPDQTHMAMLARVVDVESDYLHTGRHGKKSERHEVHEERVQYHSVLVSPEGARLGADWDQLPEPFKSAFQVQLHLMVAAHKRGELQSESKSTGKPRLRRALQLDDPS